jgi:hypothetical protein
VKLEREATDRAADPEALSESERNERKRSRKKAGQQEVDLEVLRKAALASTDQRNTGVRVSRGPRHRFTSAASPTSYVPSREVRRERSLHERPVDLA